MPDDLDAVANSAAGRSLLAGRGVPDAVIDAFGDFGLSSWCNVVAAIKTAKLLDLGPSDALVTVATDGAALYPSERAKTVATRFGGEVSDRDAAAAVAEHLTGAGTDHLIECREVDRRRIFNLGYYTWVEQQGVPIELFERRRSQSFWHGLRRYVGVWDEMIADFNARVAA